jgi:tetratricopeptide (TPR) repeat protein
MAAGMKAIDRALDVDPNNIQALMLMAKTYFDLEAFDSAEAVIDDVLIMEKQNYLARVLKGRILEEAGNRHDAMLWTQKAIRLNPSRPEAFVQEGRLLLTIGQEEDGVAAVQKALEIDKKHGPAFTLLGLFFLNKEMYEDAEGAFRVALNINPWNTEALVAMSTIALKNEEWKSVLSFSSRAIESHEDSVEAWHQKGQAELELQLWTSSIASLERAISYNPSNSEDAFLMLSAALHGAGRTKDSIARLDELLRFKPTSSKAMINKGFALQTMGKPDEALALFDKAISVDAQDNEAKFGRIGALAALGRRDEAKAYYDSFKPRNGGTEAQEAESAFQMAMQIASQTSAASQKRQQDAEAATSSSSSAFNNRTDSVDSTTSESEAQLHMDMDNLEEDANQAMSLDPNEIMNMSPEDMSRAMRMPTPSEFDANMSSDAMLSELQSEIGRVNDLLGRMGLKKMPSAPNDATGMPDYSTFGDFSNFRPDQFDPSSVDPEDLREYNQILSDLQTDIREGKMPDPTDKDSVASQLGLSPDVVQRINEMQQYFDEHGVAGEKKKIEDLKDLNIAPRKVSKQEMEQDRLAFMREFAAAAREMKPNKGKKKSSKKPL